MLADIKYINQTRRTYRRTQDWLYEKEGMVPTLVKGVGVPRDLAGCKLKDFDGVTAYDDVRKYISTVLAELDYATDNVHFNKGAGIYVSGEARTGKSTFSAALAAWFVHRGVSVAWVGWDRLVESFSEIRRLSFNDPDYGATAGRIAEEHWLMNEVYEVLIVDDIEQSAPPTNVREDVRNFLHSVVRHRQLDGHFTVLSTNLVQDEFITRYGDRFRAVLRGEFQQVLLNHEDVFSAEG